MFSCKVVVHSQVIVWSTDKDNNAQKCFRSSWWTYMVLTSTRTALQCMHWVYLGDRDRGSVISLAHLLIRRIFMYLYLSQRPLQQYCTNMQTVISVIWSCDLRLTHCTLVLWVIDKCGPQTHRDTQCMSVCICVSFVDPLHTGTVRYRQMWTTDIHNVCMSVCLSVYVCHWWVVECCPCYCCVPV